MKARKKIYFTEKELQAFLYGFTGMVIRKMSLYFNDDQNLHKELSKDITNILEIMFNKEYEKQSKM